MHPNLYNGAVKFYLVLVSWKMFQDGKERMWVSQVTIYKVPCTLERAGVKEKRIRYKDGTDFSLFIKCTKPILVFEYMSFLGSSCTDITLFTELNGSVKMSPSTSVIEG